MGKLYDRLPKYIQIKETIRSEIDSGILPEGAQLPSETVLTDRFSASKMTVIRALQELVQEGYLRRVQGKGTYVTRPSADIPIIGVVIPELVQGIFSIVLRGIEQRAHELGYGLMLCSADNDTGKVETFARQMIERKAAGIIAAPLERVNNIATNLPWYKRFRDANIPVILVDRDIPGIKDTVLIDTNNEEAMSELTHAVKRRGHRRLMFVMLEDIKSTTTDFRIAGFLNAANEYPKAECAEIVQISEQRPYAETLQVFETYLSEYEPTCVMTSHDLLAVQVLSLLKSAGSGIGEDISLTGFDDLHFAEGIGLTTVHQPLQEEGVAAVDMLHKAIRGEEIESIQIPSRVIIRSSLIPPNEKP